MRPLRDRLREASSLPPLRDDDAAAGPEPGLEPLARLERRLLGEAAEGVPLRQRLARLVRLAGGRLRHERVRAPAPRPVTLEELIPHAREESGPRGRFVLVEEDLGLDTYHGRVSLSRLRTLSPDTLAVLAGDATAGAYASFAAESVAFLDTETTGLSGGAGTAAFMVGVAFIRGERLVLRQYVMRDYDEEPAMLAAVAADLAPCTHLVTFNGRGFDVPLLDARYRLDRARLPVGEVVHLDLLPPVRRLWGQRFDSCRLQALEAALLGLHRQEDVPGEAIPGIYFDYLRSRNACRLAAVLQHNRLDVISLVALLAFCCRWIEEGTSGDPREDYGLARVLERAEVYEKSEAYFRRVVEEGAGPLRLDSLRRLAGRAKRARDHEAALPLWQQAAEEGDWWALRELAIHHEHRTRDLPAAQRAAEEALRRAEGRVSARLRDDLVKRRERVRRKLKIGQD